MLNLNKNDCTSQKFTRKKLTWKTFVTHSSESGAVRALCTAAHLQKLWHVGPTPYITDWFKVLTTRLRVLRPAQKRTPVPPNHCQLSTAVIESVLRLQTIVFFSFHENFGVVVKLGPYKPTLDLHLKKNKLFSWQSKVEYFSNLHKEIRNVARNRNYVSLWTCLTRQHMFRIFINLSM